MLIYAIGDIHGQFNMLKEMHDRIERDAKGRAHEVIHIGDLIDRGPDSKGVIDFLIEGQRAGKAWHALKGNHDERMPLFVRDPEGQDEAGIKFSDWLKNPAWGGAETIESYGIDLSGSYYDALAELWRVPESHLIFMESMPSSLDRGKYFFAHAGIKPKIPLSEQVEGDLLWIRREFLDDKNDHGAVIVHGHTPAPMVEHHGNRINIDTGAGYGRALSAIVIDGDELFTIEANGRAPLSPL